MSEFIKDERAFAAQQDALRRERARDQEMMTRARQQARDEMQRRAEEDSMRRLAEVVNDPSISVDTDMIKAINDPEVVMTTQGDVARVTRRMGNQFAKDFALRAFVDQPSKPKKLWGGQRFR